MFTLNLIEIYVVVIDLKRVEGQTKTQMQRTYSSIQSNSCLFTCRVNSQMASNRSSSILISIVSPYIILYYIILYLFCVEIM